MWMNEGDVEDAARRFHEHPLLGPATQTLANLVEWTNRNSDGWPYWQAPGNAAKRLQALIQGEHLTDRSPFDRRYGERDDVTQEMLTAALRPVKAFRTKQGADFEIVETLPTQAEVDRKQYLAAAEAATALQTRLRDLIRFLDAYEEMYPDAPRHDSRETNVGVRVPVDGSVVL